MMWVVECIQIFWSPLTSWLMTGMLLGWLGSETSQFSQTFHALCCSFPTSMNSEKCDIQGRKCVCAVLYCLIDVLVWQILYLFPWYSKKKVDMGIKERSFFLCSLSNWFSFLLRDFPILAALNWLSFFDRISNISLQSIVWSLLLTWVFNVLTALIQFDTWFFQTAASLHTLCHCFYVFSLFKTLMFALL